ncbi:hypothetical protein B0T25DRAFT_522663 [Lasiosphaeria hispida]|uniref:DUF7732 domain-containing protein n=1 Tax=Lasiosphaeria hispida TaxID=260671 RepID=A0AAJ0H6M7_9PEZI|nr:hypothetical protein B0T25DRAFT_522663 [Lasiosphaeria hispida]
MKILFALFLAYAFGVTANVVATLPPRTEVVLRPPPPVRELAERDTESTEELWKRRGGGGGGGRGGSSSSGGSSSGGSSGGGRGSSSSTAGGRTTTGSGPAPAYGGGKYYGGGSQTPYKAGSPSPSGIAPFLLIGGIGALAFWPGLWLHGAYMYPYHHPYSYYNSTTKANETKPVTCACDEYAVCGCDENSDTQYINDLIGNGSYPALNNTLITVAKVNNTDTILINGTLPNGTTAAGGDEDPNAGAGLRTLLQNVGWWPVVATVCAMVFAV